MSVNDTDCLDTRIDEEIEELLALANEQDNVSVSSMINSKLADADGDFQELYAEICLLNDTVENARQSDKNVVTELLGPAGSILEEEGIELICKWPEERRH